MVTEEDRRRFKKSIVSESSLTRTDNFKDPTRYSPGFENSPGSKIKRLVIKPTDVQHLNETQEHLNGTGHLSRIKENFRRTKDLHGTLNLSGVDNLSGITRNLSGTNHLSGTEDLHKIKENPSGSKRNRVTLKSRGKVTPKEVRHVVVNRQQPAGVQEEDVEPTDEE